MCGISSFIPNLAIPALFAHFLFFYFAQPKPNFWRFLSRPHLRRFLGSKKKNPKSWPIPSLKPTFPSFPACWDPSGKNQQRQKFSSPAELPEYNGQWDDFGIVSSIGNGATQRSFSSKSGLDSEEKKKNSFSNLGWTEREKRICFSNLKSEIHFQGNGTSKPTQNPGKWALDGSKKIEFFGEVLWGKGLRLRGKRINFSCWSWGSILGIFREIREASIISKVTLSSLGTEFQVSGDKGCVRR